MRISEDLVVTCVFPLTHSQFHQIIGEKEWERIKKEWTGEYEFTLENGELLCTALHLPTIPMIFRDGFWLDE